MAVDLSKLNFFKKLDARARVVVLLAGFIGFVLLIYLGTRFFFGESKTVGASRVANAPQGLQSVPGGQLTPEYYRALSQANVQAAQQAQISGGSSVPTLINLGSQPSGASQCIICSDESANVKNLLDDWVRQGKVTPEVSDLLSKLADQNVPVSDYAAQLDQLVKEGKLTPEQARQLLEQYKKQHTNALLADSGKTMDGLIKSSQLPLEVASQLLAAQKNKMSPADYAAMLQDLVRQGKISPATAQQLLAQYMQQRAQEAAKENLAAIRAMARSGEITPDVAKELTGLSNQGVSADQYATALNKDVTAGKLTPVAAAKLLDAYRQQKTVGGPSTTIDQLVKKAEAAAFQEISDLLKAGKISPGVAAQLTDMINRDVSFDVFQAAIKQLVNQNQLTPQIAKLKLDDYRLIKQLRNMANQLNTLQANNAPPSQYADALKGLVQGGILTPYQAAQLMQQYQALSAPLAVAPAPTGTGPGADQFARLQQNVQQGAAAGQVPTDLSGQFAAAQAQAEAQAAQERAARIQALMAAMAGQAQQLVASWQPPAMSARMGSSTVASKAGAPGTAGAGTGTSTTTTTTQTAPQGPTSYIKAGTILFAVLDTAVNSDYPDSPVLATIVQGPFKGAKLLGKLTTTKGVSGQLDRVALNFTVINMDAWTKSQTITAYAIDPDTNRTVIASAVNYHYLQRFGAIMATSFLQGYGTAVMNSGATATTGIFGTSTTNPGLSPGGKLAVAFGQIGQTLGSVTQNYVNIPPTVRVDSGVGLGILFMADTQFS